MKPSTTNYQFILIMAALMSLTALSIDAILPAMGLIRSKFEVNARSGHWIITCVFFGLSLGQVFFGPLADSIGRKKVAYVGIAIFAFGNLTSFLASDYTILLVGRFLQGLGAAAPRVVSQAMIRDTTSGPEMAKLMSFVMTVFIIVPVLAPMLGQIIIWIAPWNFIFLALMLYGFLVISWLAFSQPETLSKPRSFDFVTIFKGFSEVFQNKVTLCFMVSTGIIFGGLVSFLNMAQPLYQETYQVGEKFSFYFAGIALLIGCSSFINAKLVDRISLQVVVTYALIWVCIWSAIFLLISWFYGNLDLTKFLIFSIPAFGSYGFLFSIVNTLALMPMAHIAGTAAAVIGTCSNILAVLIGACATYFFVGTPTALISVFFLGATLNVIILIILKQFKI